MNLSDALTTLRNAVASIQSEGENAAVGIAAMKREQNRLHGLAATGKRYGADEAEKVGDDIRERSEQAEWTIRAAQQRALDAIDFAARQIASERTRFADSETVSRAWRDRVKPMVDSGASVADMIEFFRADSSALHALAANLPPLLVTKGGSINDLQTRMAIDAAVHSIDAALLPHYSAGDRGEWERAREIEGLAVQLDAATTFALRQATGLADAGDRMAYAYHVNDAERIAAGEFVPE